MIKRKGHEMKLTPADESLIKRSEKLMRDTRDEINNGNIEHLEKIAENAQHNANKLRKAFERYDLGTPEFELIRRTLVSMENLPGRIEKKVKEIGKVREAYESASKESEEIKDSEEYKKAEQTIKAAQDLLEIEPIENEKVEFDNTLADLEVALYNQMHYFGDKINERKEIDKYYGFESVAYITLKEMLASINEAARAIDERLCIFEYKIDENGNEIYIENWLDNALERARNSETFIDDALERAKTFKNREENPEESESIEQTSEETTNTEESSGKETAEITEEAGRTRPIKTPGHDAGHVIRLQRTLTRKDKRGGKRKSKVRINERTGGYTKLPP